MSEPRTTASLKQEVARRAGYCCEYCLSREDYSPSSFAVEHIQPRAGGGSNESDNLAYSCQECNNRKFTRTEALDPITGENAPLYHPRQHKWSEHFVWTEDFALVLGITPTGRATVERLRLNRTGVVNLRRILTEKGLHPPDEPGTNNNFGEIE
jgi:hypothetical protein